MSDRSLTPAGRLIPAMAGVLVILGCARAGSHTLPRPIVTEPSLPAPVLADPPPAPPPAPPPEQVALLAARGAATRGDYLHATDLYERAIQAAVESRVREAIRYELALVRLGPGNPQRDPAAARRDLEALALASPEHPRAAEARALVALLDEAAMERKAALEARAENDSIRAQLAVQKAELVEKEQELQRIKQVLLERKP